MSDVDRFENEAREAMKKFFFDIRKYAEWAIEMIDTSEPQTEAFRREMLHSTASRLEMWRKDFEKLK